LSDSQGKISFMREETAELLKRASGLSAQERAKLADAPIESLDGAEDESVQTAWDAEIVRRLEDLNSGRVKPISLVKARRRLSSFLD
jgi:putative addiction module component (TIGR02574 family)